MDPRDLRLLWEAEQIRQKNFTAGNLGDGSVYGLAPYDLAGQQIPYAGADEDEDEENDDNNTTPTYEGMPVPEQN